MNKDVRNYFKARYSTVEWRVVPGHWPDFKTINEVDDWFSMMDKLMKIAFDE